MNADFEDEYGRRLRRNFRRQRFLHDYCYPAVIAIALIGALAALKFVMRSN